MVQIKGGDKLEKHLKELSKRVTKAASVDVGFMEDATYPDGTSVAMVAALNEFGHGNSVGAKLSRTRLARWLGVKAKTATPPRPFFRGMVQEKSPEWGDAVGDLLNATGFDAEKTLNLAGEGIAGQLRQSIVDYVGPPLAESTVKRKGHDKQLVDSGVMLRSVDKRVK